MLPTWPWFFATKCKTRVAEIVWKARWLAGRFSSIRGERYGKENRMREITLEKCVLLQYYLVVIIAHQNFQCPSPTFVGLRVTWHTREQHYHFATRAPRHYVCGAEQTGWAKRHSASEEQPAGSAAACFSINRMIHCGSKQASKQLWQPADFAMV